MGKKISPNGISESLFSPDTPQIKTSSFRTQVKLLLHKQFLVFTRNFKSTLFQIFTPVFLCIFLVCLQQLADYSMSTQVDKHPSVFQVNKIPKCYGSECITVGIGLTTEKTTEFTEYAMKYLADNNDLVVGKDVKIIARTYEDTIKYLDHNTNKTQTCLMFCTGAFKPPKNPFYNDLVFCNISVLNRNFTYYSILINSTITPMLFFSGYNEPEPVDYASLAVKRNMDEAWLSFVSGQKKKLSIDVQSFPRPTNRWMSGYDIVSDTGAFYFFIPPMVTFVVLLIEIVREKEYRLRFGLLMMGMKHEAYWMTWFLTGLIFTLIVTHSLLISGLACVFEIFLNTPYPYFLFLFVLFSLSMINLSFTISTTLSTTKSAYTASYAFILVGLVFQFLLSDITMVYLLYGTTVPNWVKIVRVLLPLYPPFNFAKAYGDISLKASSHYSKTEKRWVGGSTYTWSDFTNTIHAKVAGNSAKVPSTLTSFLILFGDFLLYGLLAWYMDHIIASNRGSPDSMFFFLSKKYWGCSKRSKAKTMIIQENTKITDPSLLVPAEAFIEINNICKVFRNKKFCKSAKDIHAVKDFSLKIDDKELLAILGHNGAGKSTLIHILTGLSPCTSGSASIFGFDIVEDMPFIRRILGVCPQHDILWNELTAKEHLILFGQLKGLTKLAATEEAEDLLIKVKLEHVANRQAGTFSGGMKRRLSVAISGVGDPKVIIMDEPTTGMDPVNRRCAWKLIQEMRKNRVVLLTTHSMEEADVLSDRVCVIVDGQLKCIGTSLFLKNSFGDGFRVTIISKDTHKVLGIVKDRFSGCRVLDVSGGSVLISLPFDRVKDIEEFFATMEGKINFEFKQLVEEWGFSNTTLEEVFMRVTGKKISCLEE